VAADASAVNGSNGIRKLVEGQAAGTRRWLRECLDWQPIAVAADDEPLDVWLPSARGGRVCAGQRDELQSVDVTLGASPVHRSPVLGALFSEARRALCTRLDERSAPRMRARQLAIRAAAS
jgi:hypothetical protein